MNLHPDELTEHLHKVPPKLVAELMEIVERIPYYCGSPTCYSPGCLAIRDARDKLREIFNAAAIPNPNYKSK